MYSPQMLIGETLRELRESKKLSQGDIEKRTGLLRCYVSRVKNGHTVPSFETLTKCARALEIPLYRLFYDGDGRPKSGRASRPFARQIAGSSPGACRRNRRTPAKLVHTGPVARN